MRIYSAQIKSIMVHYTRAVPPKLGVGRAVRENVDAVGLHAEFTGVK